MSVHSTNPPVAIGDAGPPSDWVATTAGSGTSARGGGYSGTVAEADARPAATVTATGSGCGSPARVGGDIGADGGSPAPVCGAAGGASASDPRHLAASPNSPPGPLGSAAFFQATSQHYSPWTSDEADRLRVVWPDATILNDDLPRLFRRTLDAVRAKAQLMLLGKRPIQCDGKRLAAEQRRLTQPQPRTGRPSQYWTDEQVAALRLYWPHIELVAEKTGRSESAVEKKARNLRLPSKTGHVNGPLPDTVRTIKDEMRLKVRPVVSMRVARKCLCCARPFDAPTRFIRLCDRCRGQSEGLV